jgi:hypothetical protein
VPEAAIQKDDDSFPAKRKVGAADEVDMTPPPGETGATKQAREDLLGRLVATRTDGSHRAASGRRVLPATYKLAFISK